jgi:hypothetical protein
MNFEKATKKSLSLFPSVLAMAERKARKETNGNLSRYIQGLVTRDAANAPPPPASRDKIIEELAEQWMPTISDSLRRLLHEKGVNQVELLGRCLMRLRDYLAASGAGVAPDFCLMPERKCPLYAEKQRHIGLLISQGNVEAAALAALVAELEGAGAAGHAKRRPVE